MKIILGLKNKKIVADDTVEGDSFRVHVSIENDIIVVEASKQIQMIVLKLSYIFLKETDVWEQKQS